jgi:hypothetical protein
MRRNARLALIFLTGKEMTSEQSRRLKVGDKVAGRTIKLTVAPSPKQVGQG